MSTLKNRATSVLDRPGWAAAPHTEAHHAALLLPDRASATGADRPRVDPEPVRRGWGSPVERRMMLLGLAVFFALGLYAVVFVLLGVSASG